jgi:quercetin dioxygenase-like cupin family protein
VHQSTFEAELRSAGYTEIETKTLDPQPSNSEHVHEYDIRGLVIDGIFIVREGDQRATYRTGDVFAVPAGRKHSEEIGAQGACILIGRKY